MTMTLVETVTVGSGGAASIEFTSIPQDADDLLLVVSIRSGSGYSSANPYYQIALRVNGSVSESGRVLLGNGSSASSSTYGGAGGFFMNTDGATANTFSNGEIYIPNYSGSAIKTGSLNSVSENNASLSVQAIAAATWNTTSAITSFKIGTLDSLVQYSTASLYKITKA